MKMSKPYKYIYKSPNFISGNVTPSNDNTPAPKKPSGIPTQSTQTEKSIAYYVNLGQICIGIIYKLTVKGAAKDMYKLDTLHGNPLGSAFGNTFEKVAEETLKLIPEGARQYVTLTKVE